ATAAYERVRRCSFHTHFPPSLLLSCVASSTIEGEDRSFLHHRWTHLKLPLPTTSPSVASVVAVATAVQSFLRCYYCRPQLTLPLLSSIASSAAIAIICNFLHCCRHRPKVPPSPPPFPPHFPSLMTLFSLLTTVNKRLLNIVII
ncbi:hypothetical protein B296_00033773, partial [Ensete ventricosum]